MYLSEDFFFWVRKGHDWTAFFLKVLGSSTKGWYWGSGAEVNGSWCVNEPDDYLDQQDVLLFSLKDECLGNGYKDASRLSICEAGELQHSKWKSMAKPLKFHNS